MVQDHAAFYNRGVFIEPNGTVHTYDKRKAFGLGGEDEYFKNGSSEQIVTYKNWRFNLQICYDLRFPEWARNTEERRYDALIYVANWPKGRIRHWDAMLRARAIENQAYVVGVNRVGTDANHLVYPGHSACLDPMGDLLVQDNSGGVGVLYAELSKDTLNQVRTTFPFLADQ